jgi:hypothetical protein
MPIRGEASARLADGRTLTLAVNFATLARAAAELAVPAEHVFDILKNKDDSRQMLACLVLIEKALQRHHRGINEDDVGDLMLTNDVALSDALKEALAGAFGDGEAGDEAAANPPKPGTGIRSKPSGRKQV